MYKVIVLKYHVKSNQLISPTVTLLTLEPKKKSHFHFEPGQYAAISFLKANRPSPVRCFSIVNSPVNNGELQFALRIRGDFTQSAAKLLSGDTVYVQGPFGDFVIDTGFDRNVILMAGGIGITPYISMLRYAADTKLSIPITLLYACQSADDIPFYEELQSLQKRNPKFRVVFIINNPNISKLVGVTAIQGRINEEMLSRLTNDRWNLFTFFLCGPSPFMDAISDILRSNKTEEGRIVTEEFKQSKQTESLESSPQKLVYSLSSLLVILSVVGVMGVDLARAVPKIIDKENANKTSSLITQNTNAGQTQTILTPSNSSSSTNSSNTTNTNSSSSTPTTTYYQQPVTSVS